MENVLGQLLLKKDWKILEAHSRRFKNTDWWFIEFVLKTDVKNEFMVRNYDEKGNPIDKLFECESNSSLIHYVSITDYNPTQCKLVSK